MEGTILKPYEGDEKYIFISYSHRDIERVFPIIARLQQEGYRIWYDEGIDPGNEWDDAIALHITKSALLLAFISDNYLKSDNCKDELNFARDENINRVLIYLDEVDLPPGMKMRLGRQQAIYYCKYQVKDNFYEKLFASQEMKELRDIALATAVNNNTNENAEENKEPQAPKTVTTKRPIKKNVEKGSFGEAEIEAKIRKLCENFVYNSGEIKKFSCDSDVFRKNLHIPSDVELLLAHDDTVFKSGKNGFALTSRGIYNKELMENAIFVPFTQIKNPQDLRVVSGSGIVMDKTGIAYITGVGSGLREKLRQLIIDIANLVNSNK